MIFIPYMQFQCLSPGAPTPNLSRGLLYVRDRGGWVAAGAQPPKPLSGFQRVGERSLHPPNPVLHWHMLCNGRWSACGEHYPQQFFQGGRATAWWVTHSADGRHPCGCPLEFASSSLHVSLFFKTQEKTDKKL